MKTFPALVLAAVLAVGLLGGLAAYQVASGATTASAQQASAPVAAAPAAPVARKAHQRPTVRWAPCKPPAVLRGKACVTDQVRTVVVPAPAAAAPAPASPVSATHAAPAGGSHHAEPADDGHGDREPAYAEHGEGGGGHGGGGEHEDG